VLVLGAIFEADLPPEQYAYRPGGSALDAVSHVYRLLNTGYEQVVDADLSGYFDSIPHAELMRCVARRVSDGAVLPLVPARSLEAPVEETDQRGGKHRTTRNRDEGRGTPQGSPISPLLSNLYRRRFVLGWKALGHEKGLGAHIVNYADDFVICCRGNAQEALAVMRDMMSKLKLTVNEAKTHVCRMPQDTFDFLGYTFGRLYSPRTGGAYIGGRPSGKRVVRVCGEVSRLTDPRTTGLHVSLVVARLNRVIDGWANYFRLGTVSRAYRAVEQHTCRRLRRWLARKHKVRSGMKTLFTGQYLHRTLGLVDLGTRKGQPLVC
jgi:RNA-directed DNA polymerase